MSTETIHLIEKKAAEMAGRQYMFNGTGSVYRVINFQVLKGRLLVNTDKKLFDVELEHAMTLLNEFHSGVPVVVDTESQELVPLPTTPTTVYETAPKVQTLAGVLDLKAIIEDNIRRIKEDKEYLPQAMGVDSSLKTLIELAKVEIKALELQERLR